jgi:hypothetical protein
MEGFNGKGTGIMRAQCADFNKSYYETLKWAIKDDTEENRAGHKTEIRKLRRHIIDCPKCSETFVEYGND